MEMESQQGISDKQRDTSFTKNLYLSDHPESKSFNAMNNNNLSLFVDKTHESDPMKDSETKHSTICKSVDVSFNTNIDNKKEEPVDTNLFSDTTPNKLVYVGDSNSMEKTKFEPINFAEQKYVSCSSVTHCDPTAAAAQQELSKIQQAQIVLPFVEKNPSTFVHKEQEDLEPEDLVMTCLVCENPCDGKWPTVGSDRHPISGKWGTLTWSNCGPACSKFYLKSRYGHRANQFYGYQTEMQQTVFGIHDIIIAAPDPSLLMKHGGPLSRKKYNELLYKRTVLVYVAEEWFYPLPMKIVATQIHPNPLASHLAHLSQQTQTIPANTTETPTASITTTTTTPVSSATSTLSNTTTTQPAQVEVVKLSDYFKQNQDPPLRSNTDVLNTKRSRAKGHAQRQSTAFETKDNWEINENENARKKQRIQESGLYNNNNNVFFCFLCLFVLLTIFHSCSFV